MLSLQLFVLPCTLSSHSPLCLSHTDPPSHPPTPPPPSSWCKLVSVKDYLIRGDIPNFKHDAKLLGFFKLLKLKPNLRIKFGTGSSPSANAITKKLLVLIEAYLMLSSSKSEWCKNPKMFPLPQITDAGLHDDDWDLVIKVKQKETSLGQGHFDCSEWTNTRRRSPLLPTLVTDILSTVTNSLEGEISPYRAISISKCMKRSRAGPT